ncbi:MAG: rhodanese-like domain-containing protein [Aphanocapsa sp. GSE-SYN-MK-11-07L]|jgi:3-mercaptopyruvate sulfurtransferase SseA|nr:rhodanese-like domain-containing protein [Aphanocapsa sp. GSE-SYN-MK-11-07L]
MKSILLVGLLAAIAAPSLANEPISNRLIDYEAFQKIVVESGQEREPRRLTEAAFLNMLAKGNVILLDARSDSRYAMRHVKGAVNLPFTDFTEAALAKIIPSKDTKILIYCNNNFEGSPIAFASKAPSASLNLATYTSLKSYGYTNVYELGPLLDVATTKIPFAGSEVK